MPTFRQPASDYSEVVFQNGVIWLAARKKTGCCPPPSVVEAVGWVFKGGSHNIKVLKQFYEIKKLNTQPVQTYKNTNINYLEWENKQNK